MKVVLSAVLIGSILLGCSPNTTSVVERKVPKQAQDVDNLQKQVLALQGTIAQINAFIASDFSKCGSALPPFEKKICQIAQTATAEQQAIFVGQLQQVSKVFQNQIYGEECLNTTDPGCPVAGSIMARLNSITSIEGDITTLQTAVSSLQTAVTTLQNDLNAVEARLDNFNGTGSSIETVITGVQSTLGTLDTRIDTLENTVNNGDIYKTIFICENVSSSGPIYEPLLVRGDNMEIRGYMAATTANGMGVLSQAGVTGSLYYQTYANTRTCKFKVYDNTTHLKICWKNTDRSATSSAIDTACDSANNFAAPTSACTCAN
jgi:outer membrane murein-binding lipoprotein Lpp